MYLGTTYHKGQIWRRITFKSSSSQGTVDCWLWLEWPKFSPVCLSSVAELFVCRQTELADCSVLGSSVLHKMFLLVFGCLTVYLCQSGYLSRAKKWNSIGHCTHACMLDVQERTYVRTCVYGDCKIKAILNGLRLIRTNRSWAGCMHAWCHGIGYIY